MGFTSVYQTLRELFPQVDIRVLRAVALEHPKDPDSAVEYVLTQILPCSGDSSSAPTPAVESNGETVATCNASSSMSGPSPGDCAIPSSQNHGLNPDEDSLAFYDANDSNDQVGNANSPLTDGLGECSKDNHCEPLDNLDDVISLLSEDRNADICENRTGDASSSNSVAVEDDETSLSLGNTQSVQQDLNNGSSSRDLELTLVSDTLKEQASESSNPLECRGLTDCGIEDQTHNPDNSHQEAENDFNSFLETHFTHEFPETEAVGAEAQTMLSTIMTRSGQICRVDLLEDIIEEAKSYKDTVSSAMESVVKLMEEVEYQEKEVEQAKLASSRGGLDIFKNVEEIKKMLFHAKEANDMHAGEVYGEKSILATEVKELQARLLGLTDEKEKSLLILEEMRKTLEEQLAVVEEQKSAAEKELFDKQKIAQSALAEQELIMEKVVQESKLLKQEAEENAKLRDFLMEKGQVVDVLQGEISVICQDVKLLKENFNNRLSLNKSHSQDLASSNSSVKSAASLKSLTSMRSIASLNRTTSLKSTTSSKSSTSVKSTASDRTTDQNHWAESPTKLTHQSSGEWHTNETVARDEEYVSYESKARKPLLDDDWELCDMN